MLGKKFARALGCASLVALAAAATPATAQEIKRIVVFGDSYADQGNAFALGYANPQALGVYPTKRFSGGTNYIDTLANLLGVPVQNYAIGGAFGGTNNGTLCFDSFYAPGTSPLCGKGLQYEIDQFLNVGAQSAVFPDASTVLTRSDLVAVSIGGNDARFYQQAGGTLAGASAAGTAAAGGTAAQLDRLAALGDPTISFLALNGAVAPEVATNPAAQQIRGVFSDAYYGSLQNTLAGYAANGSIVHYLDGELLLQNVSADPAAFGITKGLVCPVFTVSTACLVDSSGYLFYGDALHLTSQGFEIVAHYVAAQLAAPLTLGAPGDLGLATAQQFGRTLSTRSDLYGRGRVQPGLKFYAIGDYLSRDVARNEQTSAFEVTGGGATIGAELGMPTGAVGIALNYSKPRVRFGNDAAQVDGRSWQVGAYGSVDTGGLFGQAYAGYGRDRNRINRAGVVEEMRASPNGTHVTAGVKGGYLMPFAGARIGPVVALDYAKAKVDGYTETGDPVLTLGVSGQSVKSMTGQLGIEARADTMGFRPYASVVAEHQFSGSGRAIRFAQTSAPVIVNTWDIDAEKGTYARASVGAAATLTRGISVDAAVTTTFGRDGGQETNGRVGVRASF